MVRPERSPLSERRACVATEDLSVAVAQPIDLGAPSAEHRACLLGRIGRIPDQELDAAAPRASHGVLVLEALVLEDPRGDRLSEHADRLLLSHPAQSEGVGVQEMTFESGAVLGRGLGRHDRKDRRRLPGEPDLRP